MPPYFLLIVLLGAGYGALFHLWQGESWLDLVMYLLAGALGMALGQFLGSWLNHTWLAMGSFYWVEATLISWLCLILARWIRIQVDELPKI